MAALNQFHQQFVDLPDGKTIGIHVVTLQSTSDTITVPVLDNTTSGVAVKQLLRNGQTASTVTSSSNTVTIATTTLPSEASGNREVVIVSLHQNRSNYNTEA